MSGKLITFEGIEGSGKSTQAAILSDKLRKIGFNILNTREPGGTPTGEIIRNILQHDLAGETLYAEAEALLFCASRAQLCRKILRPALDGGAWIILDRFIDSTLAYQGYGRGFNIDQLRSINEFAAKDVKPDITILIDVTVEEGLARVLARCNGARDRIEREPMEFHKRLRDGYLEIARREPERFAVFNGMDTQEETADKIWKTVVNRFHLNVNM